MIDLHEVLPGVHPGARMILQIHDELVFEVPEDEVESLMQMVSPCDSLKSAWGKINGVCIQLGMFW